MTARLEPARPPFSDSIRGALERLTPPGREPLALFRTLARDERLFSRFTGGGLLDKGNLTVREREIVIHRVCALEGAAYEWGVHAALFAGRAMLDAAQLAATVHGDASSPCWSAREAILIRFCDAAHARADVDDALWKEMSAAFGEPAVLELLMLAGFYRMVSLVVKALRLEPESWALPFPRAT